LWNQEAKNTSCCVYQEGSRPAHGSSSMRETRIPFSAKSVQNLDLVHAFRLRRHHLLDPTGKDLLTICHDVCGVQAQIMSAAQLQLWARNSSITPDAINHALWQKRSLVKTTLMRQTLHLIPAGDFPLYIAAHKNTLLRMALRVMARFKITRDEAEGLREHILDALKAGPAPRTAITQAVRPRASKRVLAWMDKVWSILRLPIAEGQICYGPGEGNVTTYIRTDQWLPTLSFPDELQAQKEVFRRYLRAYGPATLKDFAHWSGISMAEVRALRPMLDSELAEVDGWLLLRDDVQAFQTGASAAGSVHVLPHFDVYLLAHAGKEHFLEPRFYKHVYRNQGWISPVVLVNGRIAGVWGYELSRKEISIRVELFARITRAGRSGVEAKAQALAELFQRTLSLSFTR
jgi:hypothetical protein